MIKIEKFSVGNGKLVVENGKVLIDSISDITIEEFLELALELDSAIHFIETNDDEIEI